MRGYSMKDSPNYFNTLIAVITYNPDAGFRDRTIRYVEIADRIVIIDNNSEKDISQYIPEELSEHFIVIKSQTNNGIAWGLNQGALYAKQHSFLYLLTFDQDSLPVRGILNCYADIICNVPQVGLIGTSFTQKIVDTPLSITYCKKKTLITSGTIHPVAIFDEVGLYDESLFIDSVDFDFVLRVRKRYDVLCTKEPLIYHELGAPITKYGIISSNHNSIRRYYMARNHVLICKRYWMIFPAWVLKKSVMFLISVIQMVIVEKDIRRKCKSILCGIRDAYNLK